MKFEIEAECDDDEVVLSVRSQIEGPDSDKFIEEQASKITLDGKNVELTSCEVLDDDLDRFRVYGETGEMFAKTKEVLAAAQEKARNPKSWTFKRLYGQTGGAWTLCEVFEAEVCPW